jgi:hypothetical protein
MNPSEELDFIEQASSKYGLDRQNLLAVVEKSHAETRIFEQDLLDVILSRDRIDSRGT